MIKPMNIKSYIVKKGIDREKFAKLAGVSVQALNNYINGHRYPRPVIANRIVKVTDGQVTLDDLYTIPEREAA